LFDSLLCSSYSYLVLTKEFVAQNSVLFGVLDRLPKPTNSGCPNQFFETTVITQHNKSE
jgi:hypothetical protein